MDYKDYHVVGQNYEKTSFVGNHDKPFDISTLPDFIEKAPLNTKDTAGKVGQPYHTSGTLTATGNYQTNKPYLNTTASEEHRESACYPEINQDIPEKGRNQYE